MARAKLGASIGIVFLMSVGATSLLAQIESTPPAPLDKGQGSLPAQEEKTGQEQAKPGDDGSLPAPENEPVPFWEWNAPANGTRFYGSADYILWWMKRGSYPVLATQGDIADTPSGALGQPNTVPLFGGNEGPNPFSGGRFTLGLWLDRQQTWGVEANFFFLAQRSLNFLAGNDGMQATTTLAVPFFDADGNFENATQVSLPGTLGGIAIVTNHRMLGSEINVRNQFIQGENFRVCLLGGFRYLSLQESLNLGTFTAPLPLDLGISTSTFDSFATRNNFYGGQVGMDVEATRGRLVLDATAKLGIGGMCQQVNINGGTVATDPFFGTTVSSGGLFTGINNLGNHERCRFAFVPEVDVNVGYQLTQRLTAVVGYTFLYASSVVRPGDQIDRSFNFAPPNTHPAFAFHGTDFWVQGLNFGLQLRY